MHFAPANRDATSEALFYHSIAEHKLRPSIAAQAGQLGAHGLPAKIKTKL